MKKTLLAALISGSILMPMIAHAFPTIDVSSLALKIQQSIEKSAEAESERTAEEAKQEAEEKNTELKVDAINNGVANFTLRINQAYSDIFNLKQKERSEPATEVCNTAVLQESSNEGDCTGSVISKVIDQTRHSFRNIVKEKEKKGGTSGNGVASLSMSESRIAGSASLAAENENRLIHEEYEKEIVRHVDKLLWYSEAGYDEQVSRPDLLHISDSAPYQLTDEELDIAISRNFLEYPPYVDKMAGYRHTPENQTQAMSEMIIWEKASAVGAKHLALKTAGADGELSPLASMNLASKVRLSPVDSPDGSGNYIDVMMTTNPGEGATKREQLLAKAIRTKNELERYKQMLALEAQLINLGLIALEQRQ